MWKLCLSFVILLLPWLLPYTLSQSQTVCLIVCTMPALCCTQCVSKSDSLSRAHPASMWKVVSGDQSDASLVLHTVCLEVGQSVKDCWKVLDCQVNLNHFWPLYMPAEQSNMMTWAFQSRQFCVPASGKTPMWWQRGDDMPTPAKVPWKRMLSKNHFLLILFPGHCPLFQVACIESAQEWLILQSGFTECSSALAICKELRQK